MKNRNIFGVFIIATIALLSSCANDIDMTAYDQWLGEKFNQKVLWDEDSLAFRRADWQLADVVSGVQMRKSTVKMWGSVQSISFITYSPNTLNTSLGWVDREGSVGEIAGEYEGVLFAINGGYSNGSKPADSFRLNGNDIVVANATAQANGVLGLNESLLGVSMTISDDPASVGSFTSAMVTGPVILKGGVAPEFPTGDFYDTRTARSVIGTTSAGNYVMGVIDGGVAGVADGATVSEAAFIAKLMGLDDAVLLAGGDNAVMWSSEGGVLNVPSSTDKKMASIVYVKASNAKVSGEGTEETPYLIENHIHMTQIRALAKSGSTTYFKLGEDIDMSAVKSWTPVNYDGDYNRKIDFDGNGKTIYNFAPAQFVDDADPGKSASYPSLFGVLYGSCRNLTIKNSKILASETTASCGFLGGYVGTSGKPALVENVHIQGEIKGGSNCGAFGGQSRESHFKNCTADVKIVSGGTDVAGFVGKTAVSIIIEDCTANVDLTPTMAVSGNLRYGGLVGWSTGNILTIRRSSATGIIRHNENSLKTSGGICAYVGAAEAEISGCMASVELTGAKIANSGGVCGIASPATSLVIKNCYTTGYVKPHQQYGGILGRQEKGSILIENCYSTVEIDGYSGCGGIFGVKTASGTPLEVKNSFAWNKKIVSSRESADKYGSGAVAGCAGGDANTFTGCHRHPDMEFIDEFRTLQTHGDLVNGVPEGEKNQNSYDGIPSPAKSLSEAAKAAGWSADVWDMSASEPVLK